MERPVKATVCLVDRCGLYVAGGSRLAGCRQAWVVGGGRRPVARTDRQPLAAWWSTVCTWLRLTPADESSVRTGSASTCCSLAVLTASSFAGSRGGPRRGGQPGEPLGVQDLARGLCGDRQPARRQGISDLGDRTVQVSPLWRLRSGGMAFTRTRPPLLSAAGHRQRRLARRGPGRVWRIHPAATTP